MNNEGILGHFDYKYILGRLKRAEEHKWIKRFVDRIEVCGADNLAGLRGKQFVCFSNHKSHFDYIGLAYLFLRHLPVEQFPRIVAGKNLDSRLLAAIGLDFCRMGAFFIDREKIEGSSREARRRYLGRIETLTINAFYQGQSFLDFFEGGRNYFGKPASKFKTGFVNSLVEAASNPFIDINPLVIPCAIDYDRVIEERFFTILDFFKKSFRAGYYAADAAAFFARPFLREGRGSMYANFGKPVRLSEISHLNHFSGQVLQVREHVKSEVVKLYSDIQEMK